MKFKNVKTDEIKVVEDEIIIEAFKNNSNWEEYKEAPSENKNKHNRNNQDKLETPEEKGKTKEQETPEEPELPEEQFEDKGDM